MVHMAVNTLAKENITIDYPYVMNDEYKQVIEVPARISQTIFGLPCIYSCHKESVRNSRGESEDRIVYLLYDWDKDGRYIELRPGQLLCQRHNGKWEVKDPQH